METKRKQRLKAKAHALKPVVLIGQRGLTEAVLTEIDNALKAHELIKVRVNANDRQERQEMVAIICRRLEAEPVQLLGHVVTLYRENPEASRSVA